MSRAAHPALVMRLTDILTKYQLQRKEISQAVIRYHFPQNSAQKITRKQLLFFVHFSTKGCLIVCAVWSPSNDCCRVVDIGQQKLAAIVTMRLFVCLIAWVHLRSMNCGAEVIRTFVAHDIHKVSRCTVQTLLGGADDSVGSFAHMLL